MFAAHNASYSISQEICMRFCFAVLCCGYTLADFPYPSGLLVWHCGNLTIAPVPTKQPWWIWINTSCEFIMDDCITTTKQSTTKPCAYFLGYTVLYLTVIFLDVRILCWEVCLRHSSTQNSVQNTWTTSRGTFLSLAWFVRDNDRIAFQQMPIKTLINKNFWCVES